MKKRISIALIIVVALLGRACKKDDLMRDDDLTIIKDEVTGTPYTILRPAGFPDIQFPPDNPTTVEGIALGRRLFYDPILSADSTLSCAGCHAQKYAFSDSGRQFSTGIDSIEGNRNASAIMNVIWSKDFFWEGRSIGLEGQALQPVPNPIEMHQSWLDAEKKLNAHPEYPELFLNAFGTKVITSDLVVKAIAQFERIMISADSRYDKILRNEDFFTEEELRGREIYTTEKGDCFHCHPVTGGLFMDNIFHNNGLDSVFSDIGREAVTGLAKDRGKFKTPTLRNIEFTAPYMHDGRFKTLEEVIDFYSEGLVNSATIDPLMKNVHKGGVQLSPDEKADLIAFLKTLSDYGFLFNPELSEP